MNPKPSPAPQLSQPQRQQANASKTDGANGNSSFTGMGITGVAAAVGLVGLVIAGVFSQESASPVKQLSQTEISQRSAAWEDNSSIPHQGDVVAPQDYAAAIATMNLEPNDAKALLASLNTEETKLISFLAWDPDGTKGATAKFMLPGYQTPAITLTEAPQKVYVALSSRTPVPMTVVPGSGNMAVGLGFINLKTVADFRSKPGSRYQIPVYAAY